MTLPFFKKTREVRDSTTTVSKLNGCLSNYPFFIACYLIGLTFFYSYLYKNAQNIPIYDDYRCVLTTLIDWAEKKSFQTFFSLLTSQCNEHKVIFVRFFSILLYEAKGAINFRHLIFIGNLFFILCPLLFLINRKIPPYFYTSILPLFFSATPHDSSLWAMASLQNFTVVFLAIMATRLAFNDSRHLNWLAIPTAFLATLSQGNGIVIFFLLSVYAIVKWDSPLKIGYIFGFSLAIVLYFYNWQYSTPNISPYIAIKDPLLALRFATQFIGAAAFEPNFAIALTILLAGISLLFRTLKPGIKANDFILLFILLSAAMTTLNRLFLPESATTSRYSIYSLLFMAVVFCELGELTTQAKKRFILFLTLTCLSTSYAIYSWHRTAQERKNYLIEISQLHFEPNGDVTGVRELPWLVSDATKTLQRSNELGIYTPPPR